MKTPRQKTLDSNTDRAADERAYESAQKQTPRQAPLKKHGQPAWRKVREE